MTDEVMARADSLASKAARLDTLFYMNSKRTEFLKASDDRSIVNSHVSLSLQAVLDSLEKDNAKYSPSRTLLNEEWRGTAEDIVFYYCNDYKDAVLSIDSLAINVYPKSKGFGWLRNNRDEINNWFIKWHGIRSLFADLYVQDTTETNPVELLEILENARYFVFINNDCVLFPYITHVPFESFNPGAARVNIKIFDLSAETYQQPLATLQAFSKNSTQIEVTKKQRTVAGHTFEYDDADEKVTADLYANVEREVKWVIFNYMDKK